MKALRYEPYVQFDAVIERAAGDEDGPVVVYEVEVLAEIDGPSGDGINEPYQGAGASIAEAVVKEAILVDKEGLQQSFAHLEGPPEASIVPPGRLLSLTEEEKESLESSALGAALLETDPDEAYDRAVEEGLL